MSRKVPRCASILSGIVHSVHYLEKVIIIANHLRDKVPDRLHCVVSQL